MRVIKPIHFSLLLLLVSSSSLAAAYIAQFGFGLKPCHLCLYQRIPYAGVIALSLVSLLVTRYKKLSMLIYFICGCVFLIGAGIAVYHVGVEHHIFEGLSTCAGQESIPTTVEEMRNQLLGTPAVRCDVPAFMFLGLSMAGWNMVCSAILGIFTLGYSLKIKNSSQYLY